MRLDAAEFMFPTGTRAKCARTGRTFTVQCYRRRSRYDKLDVIGTSPDNHNIGYLSYCGHPATTAKPLISQIDGGDRPEITEGLRRSGHVRFD